MTAAERILEQAAVEGLDIRLAANGQPVVSSPAGSRPNAAMMAALRENREAIIRLLGGKVTRIPVDQVDCKPDDGEQTTGEQCKTCEAWVYWAVDSEFFCQVRRCGYRRRARHQ